MGKRKKSENQINMQTYNSYVTEYTGYARTYKKAPQSLIENLLKYAKLLHVDGMATMKRIDEKFVIGGTVNE